MVSLLSVSGGLGLLLTLLLGGVALVAFVFWIWMLVDAITNKVLSTGEKVVWVLVIIFLHFLGALLYLLVGRGKRLSTS